MNLQELITLCRADSQDEAEGHFTSDELLTLYANQAQVEACRRARLLRKSARIEYKAGDRMVKVDPKTLAIMRAVGDRGAIDVFEIGHMDRHLPNWQRDNAIGTLQAMVTGLDTDTLHLWPVPRQAGFVDLLVQTLPEQRMVALTDCPEIREEAHSALVEWMLYKVYSRQDGELFNAQKAAEALKNFEHEFGRKASIKNETWVRDGQGMLPEPIA